MKLLIVQLLIFSFKDNYQIQFIITDYYLLEIHQIFHIITSNFFVQLNTVSCSVPEPNSHDGF